MELISSKARSQIYKLIDVVISKYIEKSSVSQRASSGNPFIIALLHDFEPLLHRIHGLKGSIGTEMEKIAEIIAKETWGENNVRRKISVNVILPQNVFQTIDTIINNLSNSKTLPNYKHEKQLIIDACNNATSDFEEHKYEFDLELYDPDKNNLYYLEMKGPDPNTTEVPGAKKRLLAEMAWAYFNKECKNIDVIFAIYYNNKYPKPYKNPKVLYYFDPDGGLLVHNEFWDFLGKKRGAYEELLEIFAEYGEKNKKRIWEGFSKLINIDSGES